ncbi:MAG TPA: 3'-5' exonuclease, partial [Solirubrobacteraceae bacterium]
LEEERRLAYVAITRARDRLLLSWARVRRTYDQYRANEPSRFIAQLPAELVVVRARRPPAGPPRESDRVVRRPQQPAPPPEAEPVYYLDEIGDDDPVYPRGARVRHRIFGVGLVEDGTGRGPDRKLAVRFPDVGVKTLVARYVERIYD